MPTKEKVDAVADDSSDIIKQAIAEGRKLIAEGKTKIDAAMAMYRMIEKVDQDAVVAAFVEGASLTPKGALTYWYNCRRKLARERRGESQK